jgi:rod shape-determining protein MreD
MRNVTLIGLGFALLVAQAAISSLVPMHPWTPNLILPVAIYLGVSHDVNVVRGAAISFVLGYLLDSFCGSAMGLQTFVMVSTFMMARGAGLRLFLRGPAFQIALTFIVGILAGGTVLALRAIFEPPAPFTATTLVGNLKFLVVSALVTALTAPLVFAAVRRTELVTIRRREGTA